MNDDKTTDNEPSVNGVEPTNVDAIGTNKKDKMGSPGFKTVTLLSLIAAVAIIGGVVVMNSEEEYQPVSVAPERSWNNEGTSQDFLPEARVIEGIGESTMTMPDNEQDGKLVSFDIVSIDGVGGQSGATLAPPERIDQIGHYVRSPQAGADNPQGSALYTSHVNYAGEVGVGSIWSSLKEGDPITFTDDDGQDIHYTVIRDPYRIEKSDPDYVAKTAETINDMDSTDGRVVLVSCGGDFVGGALGYEDNEFIIAEPVK